MKAKTKDTKYWYYHDLPETVVTTYCPNFRCKRLIVNLNRSMIGKVVRCPDCSTEFELPVPDGTDAYVNGNTIVFSCSGNYPYCTEKIVTTKDMMGTVVYCPACEAPHTVPTIVPPPPVVIQKVYVPVPVHSGGYAPEPLMRCPHCGTGLRPGYSCCPNCTRRVFG